MWCNRAGGAARALSTLDFGVAECWRVERTKEEDSAADYAGGCHPASAQSSPLTAEFEIMKQIASAISCVVIKRRS
jgi:hypothetical protein